VSPDAADGPTGTESAEGIFYIDILYRHSTSPESAETITENTFCIENTFYIPCREYHTQTLRRSRSRSRTEKTGGDLFRANAQ
jgi:hypothetical protein